MGGNHPEDDQGVDDHAVDEHAHDGEMLGPIDYTAWGAGILGVAVGLVMWLCFVLATSVAAGS